MRREWKKDSKKMFKKEMKRGKKKGMKQKQRGKYRRRNEEKAKSIRGSDGGRGKDHKEGTLKELFTKHLIQKS